MEVANAVQYQGNGVVVLTVVGATREKGQKKSKRQPVGNTALGRQDLPTYFLIRLLGRIQVNVIRKFSKEIQAHIRVHLINACQEL